MSRILSCIGEELSEFLTGMMCLFQATKTDNYFVKMKNSNKLVPILPFILNAFFFILILSSLFASCSSNRQYRNLDVERLFMQTTKPGIDFMYTGGLQGQDGRRTVSEEVSFTSGQSLFLDEGGGLPVHTGKLDTSKVYEISEVVVKVKSHFTSERDGKVNLDFKIFAPVDVLDPNWRLVLSPKLIDGDSICPLDTVVLVGEGFKEKQLSDYEAYDEFLSTIIDPSAYDSLFMNWKTLYKEITKEQKRNYLRYKAQYDLMRGYENWKKMNEMEFLSMESVAMRHKKHMYSKYWRKAEEQILKNLEKGKSAEGIHEKYGEKYKKDYVSYLKNTFSLHWMDSVRVDLDLHRQKDSIMKRTHIPKKYREIHASGRQIADIQAKAFTPEDSARISKHHYLIDEIVLNDLNISRQEDVFREIVEFPYYGENNKIKTDSVVTAEDGVVYHYRQAWPIRPGMKNLKLVLESKVEAVDRSAFTFPSSDTLTFYIATLSQLVDESLVTERKTLYKNLFQKGEIYPVYKNRKAFQYDEKLNTGVFDSLLEAYTKYATNPEFTMDSVTILCSVDLLGEWDVNYEQSQKRAEAIAAYLSGKIQAPVVIRPKGEDWNTLVKEIKMRSDLVNATAILDSLGNAVFPDKTEETIAKLYPVDYKIIRNEIYPKLNRVNYFINFCRADIESDTIRETYREDYAEGIRLLKNGEYLEAFKALAKYGDYNVALCLVCLGYNDKAQEVLDKLPESPRNEYLSAIVFARKNDDREASRRLLNACKLDPSLYFRVSLDSEVESLANRLNLWPKLSKY